MLGWDIARAPANLAMVAPQAGSRPPPRARDAWAPNDWWGCCVHRLPDPCTAVAREVAWPIQTELLELPARDGSTREARRRRPGRDDRCRSTADHGMRPMIAAIEAFGTDPALRARIETAIVDYAVTRIAVAEITTALLSLGTGAAALSNLDTWSHDASDRRWRRSWRR